MKTMFLHILFCFLTATILTQQVYADEVLTTVDEAVNQYKNGDYDGAASNLDYAVQLIRQKKSEALIKVFPEPLAGWEAEPATSQATGTAVFGGSVSVSRTYLRKPSTVTIDIASDSPVMQSLVMMLNNPVIAGAGGAKLESFNTHRGIVQYNETNRSGDVNIVVDDRFMVTVKGQEIDRDDLIAYAQAVKYSELVQK
jgi:hypothetical protein